MARHSSEDVVDSDNEQEEEQQGNERRRGRGGDDGEGRRKKKKKRLEELTEEERREVRRQQRALNQEIDQTTALKDMVNLRDNNNVIFEKGVHHTREAVLDSQNVDAISKKYVQAAEKLVQVPRYDAIKFVQKLRSKCGVRDASGSQMHFNWLLLGREAGICFNSVPDNVRFMAGPLEANRPTKERAKVQRQANRDRQRMANVEEIRPEEVKEQTTDDDKASAADRAMKEMHKKLKLRSQDAQVEEPDNMGRIDGVQFLFNPKSFTQTVENIFNFSFLIKRGEAMIEIADEMSSRPGLNIASARNEDGAEGRQCVCSFTMRDWRRLIKAHGRADKECDLGHRNTKMRKGDPILTQDD